MIFYPSTLAVGRHRPPLGFRQCGHVWWTREEVCQRLLSAHVVTAEPLRRELFLRPGGGRFYEDWGRRKMGFEYKDRGEESTGDHPSENRKGSFIWTSLRSWQWEFGLKSPYPVTMGTEILLPNDNPKKGSQERGKAWLIPHDSVS